MRATSVKYERVFNRGNFETERIGIEVELDEGERARDAIAAARRFVLATGHGVVVTATPTEQPKNTDDDIPF